MTKHYTVEELELYRHGEMSILSRLHCKSHLNECEECRKKLQNLKEDDLLVRELRSTMMLFEELGKDDPQKRNTSTNAH